MKRHPLILSGLLLLCCLLCGCSAAPLSQPPDDSLVVGTPRVQFIL